MPHLRVLKVLQASRPRDTALTLAITGTRRWEMGSIVAEATIGRLSSAPHILLFYAHISSPPARTSTFPPHDYPFPGARQFHRSTRTAFHWCRRCSATSTKEEASRVVISERDSVEDINQNSGAETFAFHLDPAEVAAILQEIQEFEQEFEQNLSANPSFELDPELEPNYFPIERYVPAPARMFNNDLPRLNLPPPDSPPAMDTDPDTFATSRQSGKRSRGPDVGAELNPSNGSEGRPKRTLRPTKKARGLAHDEKSEEEA
ncbi:hypothetical protein C8F01DRAFT_1127295 [Mycena amicta]|nr:hypothetical protein C8F01DRAFT_1127295 [Mycena amicta]